MARALHRGGSGVASPCLARRPRPSDAAALRALEAGELRVVFSVDVLGEGVDVPSVDTVLLLRPTDSATVFTQQLGRGLRRADGKPYLTVIDLIGQQHRQFRFDRRLRCASSTAGAVRSRSSSRQGSRSCRPGATSSSTARARRSCSTIYVMRRDSRSGGRWSTTCAGCRHASLAQFLNADRPRRRSTSTDARTTAGRGYSAMPARSVPARRARRTSAICSARCVGCCTSTTRSASRFYRELLARDSSAEQARLRRARASAPADAPLRPLGHATDVHRSRRVIARALVARVRSRRASRVTRRP